MNEDLYYYQKNAQEDIIGLLDSNYNLIATYEYDSWGNVITIKDALGNIITDANNIAIINPYRYRSYYYDKETNLYYLNSRYYNPIWGRFINADGKVDTMQGMFSNNMFCYTENNFVSRIDISGFFWFPIACSVIGLSSTLIINGIFNMLYGERFLKGWISSAISGALIGYFWTTSWGISKNGQVTINYLNSILINTIDGITANENITTIFVNSVVDGTVSTMIPDVHKINSGWYKPTKVVTSFKGNYTKKITINMIVNLAGEKILNPIVEQFKVIVKTGNNIIEKVGDFIVKWLGLDPNVGPMSNGDGTGGGFAGGNGYGGGNGSGRVF